MDVEGIFVLYNGAEDFSLASDVRPSLYQMYGLSKKGQINSIVYYIKSE